MSSSSFISSSSSKSKSSSGFSSSSSGGRYDKNRCCSAAAQLDTCSSFSSTIHRKTHPPSAAAAAAIITIPKKSKLKSTNLNLNLNLSGMVSKLLMEKRSSPSASKAAKGRREFTGDDITSHKTSSNSGALVGLMHKKLFGNNNSRSLGMVLKSERELLSVNKEQEALIIQLNSILVQKNAEIDKLKDLCLKQREEIKSLKTDILFPAQHHHHRHRHLQEEQDLSSSMSLQRQVTSLTHQLHSLAQDLAQVKADNKYSVQGSYDDGLVTSPNLTHDQEEATNSLEFSTTPGSPDDIFLNDLNPCLTPYAKSNSKDFESHSSSYNNTTTRCHEVGFGSHSRKL